MCHCDGDHDGEYDDEANDQEVVCVNNDIKEDDADLLCRRRHIALSVFPDPAVQI